MKFSAKTGGFYCEEVHGEAIPDDAVDIPDDLYAQLKGEMVVAGPDGLPCRVVTHPLTESQREVMAAQLIKAMLDELAQSWQYSSYESARTYKGDINPKFNAEGTALANYGSTCYAYLDRVKSGDVARPADAAGLLAALPLAPARPIVD